MIVTNDLYPSEAQINSLLTSDFEGPVSMLNLLRFKDSAVYDDGRETDLTGQQAYGLYAEQMTKFVAANGGRFLFYGSAEQLMIGSVEDLWHNVAIVEYSSKENFVETVMAPEVAEFAVHRTAGLAGQLLIATRQGG